MYKNKFIDELHSCGKNVFRELHELYRYDFEKPFTVLRFDSPFTVSYARKMAKLNGFDDDSKRVFLFVGYGNYLSAIELVFNAVHITRQRKHYEDSFSLYSAKTHFLEDIKTYGYTFYLVCQKSEYLVPIKPAPYLHWLERYKPICGRTLGINKIGDDWMRYDSARDVIADGGNKVYHYCWDFNFDKSGYCVETRHYDLRDRARALRAEREKAKIDNADVEKKYCEIQKALLERKMELINMLMAAKSEDDFAKVGRAIGDDRYSGYAGAVYNAREYEVRTSHNSFRTVEEYNSDFAKIMVKLGKEVKT